MAEVFNYPADVDADCALAPKVERKRISNGVRMAAHAVECVGLSAIFVSFIAEKVGWLDKESSKKIGLTGLVTFGVSASIDVFDLLEKGGGEKIAQKLIDFDYMNL